MVVLSRGYIFFVLKQNFIMSGVCGIIMRGVMTLSIKPIFENKMFTPFLYYLSQSVSKI